MQTNIIDDLYVLGSIYCTNNIVCGTEINNIDKIPTNIISGNLYVYGGKIKSLGNISLCINKPLIIKEYNKNSDDVIISGDLLVSGNIICIGDDIYSIYDIDRTIIRKHKINILKEKMRTN